MTEPVDAIRAIEGIVDAWYQTGERPNDALLNIRKAAREADLEADEPVTEHAVMMSGGGMHVRNPFLTEDHYPLAEWTEHQQRDGGKVFRRRVIVVEDWTEVPRG